MRYEWKKISRYVLILLVLTVAVNAWLFYRHCTDASQGYSLKQIQEKFDWPVEKLEAENAVLEKRVFAFDTGETYLDASLLTGNVYHELSLNNCILERRSLNYDSYLDSVQAESDFRIHSGMFGDENSFSVRSMSQIKKIYGQLSELRVEPTFSGTTEAFRGWQLSDLFFLFFGCVPSLVLLTQERRSGMLALLRPMKHGHGGLYIRKYAAMTGMVLLGFVLIYGADFAITVGLFGTEGLSAPIQSVFGLYTCPTPFTVVGYLLVFFSTKLLWGWCISTLFFAICAVFSQVFAVFGVSLGILAVSMVMESTKSLWLRAFSLFHLADTEALYRQCLFLDFFGRPVRQLPVSIAFCIILIPLCFIAGWFAFVRKPGVSASKGIKALRLHGLNRHTNLFLHEGQKLWGMHGAMLLLIALVLVQVASYQSFDAPSSSWDYYYQQYSKTLSGAPCEASDRFLAEEQKKFDDIHIQISNCYTDADGESSAAQQMADQLQDKLRPEEAFQEAKQQYEALREGQHYIYRTGYERLFGRRGQKDDLVNTIKLLLFLILALSGVFAIEKETNMEILLQCAGAKRKSAVRKLINCAILLLIAFWVCYFPQFISVYANYSLPDMGAMANSLGIFAAFSNSWTIRGVLIAAGLMRLLVAAGASGLILFFSHKTGNKITTILLSVGALVLPALIVQLLFL
jgi:hypothetical protein